MFSSKIRIKEARGRRSAAAGQAERAAAASPGHHSDTDSHDNHAPPAHLHKMANGKSVSIQHSITAQQQQQHSRREHQHQQAYFDEYGYADMMDIGDDDIGGGMGGGGGPGHSSGSMFHMVDMDEMMGHGLGGSAAHHIGRRGEKHIDRVVHTDFFNKFDDLLDLDDLE